MKNAVHDLRSDVTLRVELKGVRSKKALLEALAVGLKLPQLGRARRLFDGRHLGEI